MACRCAALFSRVHGGPRRRVEDVAVADDGGGPALVLGPELTDFVAGSEGGIGFGGHCGGTGTGTSALGGYGRGLAWLGIGRKSRESSLYGESVEAEVCGELKIVRHPGPRTRGMYPNLGGLVNVIRKADQMIAETVRP